jgi:hypothetical protein
MIEILNVTGDAVFAYLRATLSRGRSLSKSIKDLPIEEGRVFSFVPSGTTRDSLYAFENGGLYLTNSIEKVRVESSVLGSVVPVSNDARPSVIEQILMRINGGKDNFCLFEEPVMWPSDPNLAKLGLDYVYIGDEQLFYFFDTAHATAERIGEAIKVSDDYIFLCALSSLASSIRFCFTPSKEISPDFLVSFAKNVDTFFIGAYDGEGYLMWTKE